MYVCMYVCMYIYIYVYIYIYIHIYVYILPERAGGTGGVRDIGKRLLCEAVGERFPVYVPFA